jgi:ankyrin repeat protein
VIGKCGNEQQRKAAVNATDPSNEEMPLQAAHRLQRGDLVGALLEAGADASALFPLATPLVLCIAYGLVDSLRALLKAGHDPTSS